MFNNIMQAFGWFEGLLLGGGVAIVILLVSTLVSYLAWYFITAVGYVKMFEKAGEKGWKAFIPLYNDYIRFKMGWKTQYFWFYLVALIASDVLYTFDNVVISIIAIICGIIWLVFCLKRDIGIAKSFGKGTGFGVLLFFFPFVISLILGFGKEEYIGSPAEKK